MCLPRKRTARPRRLGGAPSGPPLSARPPAQGTHVIHTLHYAFLVQVDIVNGTVADIAAAVGLLLVILTTVVVIIFIIVIVGIVILIVSLVVDGVVTAIHIFRFKLYLVTSSINLVFLSGQQQIDNPLGNR
jgi:hypothetical protein